MKNDLEKTIPLAGTVDESVVDGEGIRYVIFVQGCHHACRGCHNPQMWEMKGGDKATLASILNEVKSNPLLHGITFSGGEPFLYSKELSILAKEVQSLGKSVWCYTGYTHNELKELEKTNPDITALLSHINVLVDGKYIEELKDETISFRGSSNQNIIYLS
ncbi:MAG: anaerobic ribonucleoside-triphosphate reductase activating protein [Firmicutes bacterium]|nr:anaerobic ribonucleoside-triphosphate reductase activating protein [Bacillota bacterium]